MTRPRSLLPACVFGALVAAGFEGVNAAHSTLQADSTRLTALLAFGMATAVILAPTALFALGLDLAVSWGDALASRWTSAGSPVARAPGSRRLSWPWRLTVQIALVGEAATIASIAGRKVIGSMSAHFAATLIVLLALAGGAVALVLARLALFLVEKALAWTTAKYPERRGLIEAVEAHGGGLVLTATALLVANALVPAEQFTTPSIALVAGVLFHVASQATGLADRLSHRWMVRGTLVAALAAMISLRGVEHLPGRARQSVLYRTPWASLTLGVMRHAFDHDRDGYSPYFGGGDCNDRDATVHPDAFDIPGDGVDQNCSGADATPPVPEIAEPARTSTRSERWSFVLVHIDALRPDHLSFAGYSRPTSPNLDSFRQRSTYFSNAYSLAPATRFAMSSLFTGKDVDHVPQRRGPALDFRLLPEAQTLAERLEPLGYDRAGYTIAYVMQHIPGIGQGFRVWDTPWPVLDEGSVSGRDATLTTDASDSYLDTQAAGAPFLLYAHYQCTHTPYVKHKEWDYGDTLVDDYDSALSYCDQQVGRLLQHVEQRGDHDHVAVIVFSDHGELLGEHGLGNHGTSLFQEELRSLLLVHLPWQTPPTIDTRVTLTDLYPTILELAGAPKDPTTHAWSLVPLFDGTAHTSEWQRPFYLYIDQWRGSVHLEERGVLDGSYKYVRDVASGASFLYDEEKNPLETSNLRKQMPAKTDLLAGMVDAEGARKD